jgi:hypothetical protein
VATGLLLLLGACGGGGGHAEPPQGEYPVVLFDTTRIADASTRGALSSYDPDTGAMRFNTSTPLLDALAAGDVLAAEPSLAAPYGYLRRVTAVRREGDEVALETEQAKLTDAVKSGTLRIDAARPALPAAGPPAAADNLAQIGIGGGFEKGFVYDKAVSETICLDDDHCDAGNIRVAGRVRSSVGYRLVVGVDYQVPASLVAYFEASAGGDSTADLDLTAQFRGDFKKEKEVGRYSDVFTASIGPLPVVILVESELYVGVDGSAQTDFGVGVSPTVSALIGARWTSSDGASFLPGPQASLNFRPPTLQGDARIHAYARTAVNLKLYGVFGPRIDASGGGELECAFPRDPLWTVWGRAYGHFELQGKVPIIDVPFDLSRTIFDERFKVGDAPVQPPVLTVARPSVEVVYKKPVDLSQFFLVRDPQGRRVTTTASSSVDGTLPGLSYTFATAGTRTITLTASNGDRTSQATLTVDAPNVAPVVRNAGSGTTIPLGIPLFLDTSAFDPNEPENRLPCDRIRWSVTGSDLLTTETGSSFGCQPKISFSEVGARAVTVRATDPEGLSSTVTLPVEVSARPPQLPPIADRIEVRRAGVRLENGQQVALGTGLALSVALDNPDASPASLEWSAEQVPRPEDCTPTPGSSCAIFFNPRRVMALGQGEPSVDWAAGAGIPGFTFPTERRCVFPVPPNPDGSCDLQSVPVAARVVILLRVTSPVAPDLVQTRTFTLQLAPSGTPPN